MEANKCGQRQLYNDASFFAVFSGIYSNTDFGSGCA